ncbi:MAG TPA: hypothetical protein VMF69_06465 [Gemmataceae bacterium]|nr:hypothetical protein [Gemmataceae bacterium]
MSTAFRLRLLFGFVAFSVLSVPTLWAAEEPAVDLHPLPPVARAVFGNNPQSRMYSNGSSQAFSADGKTLYLMGHQGLTFWDLDDSKTDQPRTLRMENFQFFNAPVALSPDGKTAAAVSMMGGNQDSPIRFFDAITGKEFRQIENDQQIQGLRFSPDGRLLAVATQQRIELWDADNGDEVRVFPAAQNTFYRLAAFSPDGKMLAAVANTNRFPAAAEDAAVELHVWETASGKERTRLRLPPPLPPTPSERNPRMYYANRGINGLAFSADSRFLAAGGNDSAVHLWDLQKGKEAVPLTGFEGNAAALVFTPDGTELIAMSLNGSRLSWRMEEVRRINDLRLSPLSESAFAGLWNELAQTDVFRAYRAGRHLLADPQRAVSLLGAQMKPVPPGDSARLNKLAADLGNASAAVRRKAMMELRSKHGEAAVGALRQNFNRQRNFFRMGFEQKLINQYNTPERARDLKAVRILEEIGTPEARQMLEKMSKGAAGVSLTLDSKAALDRLAAAKATPPQPSPDDLWSDLGGDDAARAYRAMGRLSATPKETVSLLGERLKPAAVIEAKELASQLANLEADDLPTREQASEALEKAGEQAVPVLRKALDHKPALETRKRIEQLLERLTQQTPPAVLQSLRAIEVLEQVGTADAKHVLLSVSGGAPPALATREAKASLQRLARR